MFITERNCTKKNIVLLKEYSRNQAADHDIVVAVSTSMFANHPD
jgi:hypothetical protein